MIRPIFSRAQDIPSEESQVMNGCTETPGRTAARGDSLNEGMVVPISSSSSATSQYAIPHHYGKEMTIPKDSSLEESTEKERREIDFADLGTDNFERLSSTSFGPAIVSSSSSLPDILLQNQQITLIEREEGQKKRSALHPEEEEMNAHTRSSSSLLKAFGDEMVNEITCKICKKKKHVSNTITIIRVVSLSI